MAGTPMGLGLLLGDPLELVISFLEAEEGIGILTYCNRRLHHVTLSNTVWHEQCKILWHRKLVPQRFEVLKEEGKPKEAYWRSRKDAERVDITRAELLNTRWSMRFKEVAGPAWQESDPWWSGQPARHAWFGRNGNIFFDEGEGRGNMPRLTWRFVLLSDRYREALRHKHQTLLRRLLDAGSPEDVANSSEDDPMSDEDSQSDSDDPFREGDGASPLLLLETDVPFGADSGEGDDDQSDGQSDNDNTNNNNNNNNNSNTNNNNTNNSMDADASSITNRNRINLGAAHHTMTNNNIRNNDSSNNSNNNAADAARRNTTIHHNDDDDHDDSDGSGVTVDLDYEGKYPELPKYVRKDDESDYDGSLSSDSYMGETNDDDDDVFGSGSVMNSEREECAISRKTGHIRYREAVLDNLLGRYRHCRQELCRLRFEEEQEQQKEEEEEEDAATTAKEETEKAAATAAKAKKEVQGGVPTLASISAGAGDVPLPPEGTSAASAMPTSAPAAGEEPTTATATAAPATTAKTAKTAAAAAVEEAEAEVAKAKAAMKKALAKLRRAEKLERGGGEGGGAAAAAPAPAAADPAAEAQTSRNPSSTQADGAAGLTAPTPTAPSTQTQSASPAPMATARTATQSSSLTPTATAQTDPFTWPRYSPVPANPRSANPRSLIESSSPCGSPVRPCLFGQRAISAKVMGRGVPTYCVRREPKNWGWILESCWVIWTSWDMPRRGDPDFPELVEKLLPVTVGLQQSEAMRYNHGVVGDALAVGHDRPDRFEVGSPNWVPTATSVEEAVEVERSSFEEGELIDDAEDEVFDQQGRTRPRFDQQLLISRDHAHTRGHAHHYVILQHENRYLRFPRVLLEELSREEIVSLFDNARDDRDRLPEQPPRTSLQALRAPPAPRLPPPGPRGREAAVVEDEESDEEMPDQSV